MSCVNNATSLSVDTVSQKLGNNNIFTIAKRNVEGQDMLYQSMKLTNGIWCLAELKIQPGNSTFTVSLTTNKSYHSLPVSVDCTVYILPLQLSLKSRATEVYEGVHQAYDLILHN